MDVRVGHLWIWELNTKELMAFELNWRRLLRVPWTARRSNQSILKEISPEYSLRGLMLKLKLQYFGHLMWRSDSLKKTLVLGKIEGRKRGGQGIRRLDGITDSMDTSLIKSWWWTGRPSMLQSMGSQTVGHDWGTELNWYFSTIYWLKKSFKEDFNWKDEGKCMMPSSFYNNYTILPLYIKYLLALFTCMDSVGREDRKCSGSFWTHNIPKRIF